jgi:hypothetical protein
MDKTTFDSEMETALGGNLVDVELTDTDYDYAFKRAKRTFQQKGNNNIDHNFYALNVLSGVQTYTIDSSIRDVIRIIRPGSNFSSQNPFHQQVISDLFAPMYGGGGETCGQAMNGSGALLIYEMTQAYLEDVNRYTLHDVMFHHNFLRQQLNLYTVPSSDQTWLLEVYSDLTDSEYRELPWIQEYALAELKIILGRAYRKFATLSTPAGDNTIDGDQLVAEGREDQLRLLTDIKEYTDGDATGSIILMG